MKFIDFFNISNNLEIILFLVGVLLITT